MADINERTIAELLKLGRASTEVRTAGNTPFVVIPKDHEVVGLERFVDNARCEHPLRKRSVVKVLDTLSFCQYYTLFADTNSRVFADETSSKILAILDYHGAGSEGAPRWGEHRIDLTLRHSEEWETWNSKDGEKFAQAEFAEFLEDNTPDIQVPAAAFMLDVARSLSAKSSVEFSSAIRLSDGSVQFKYSEQVQGSCGGGNIEVPEQFQIAIPIYIGCERVAVVARLRYRITGGRLTFWYNLLRPVDIKRAGFIAVRTAIADTLNINIVNGSPA